MHQSSYKNLKRSFLSYGILVLCLFIKAPLAQASDGFPQFSWDHVPLYAHVGKSTDDFTSDELDFLAKHFNFITIEKGQAVRKRGDTESGTAEAISQIKQRNPNAKVLFYWNTFLDFPLYKSNHSLSLDGHLMDKQGNPVLIRNSLHTYDLTLSDVRAWWSDTAESIVNEIRADGVFADATLQVTAPGKRKLLGDEKYQALVKGLIEMLQKTSQNLGSGKIIIFNGLRGKDGAQFLPYTSGAMIEHFGYFADTSKEKMAQDLDAMTSAAKLGKIVCFKVWPEFSWQDEEIMKQSHLQLTNLAQQRIIFPLACFLVAAQANCYFCYTWGYKENDGTFDWYPEFDKPLGPPMGEAKRNGWIYQRDFAHASVSVDLENKIAHIDWKD